MMIAKRPCWLKALLLTFFAWGIPSRLAAQPAIKTEPLAVALDDGLYGYCRFRSQQELIAVCGNDLQVWDLSEGGPKLRATRWIYADARPLTFVRNSALSPNGEYFSCLRSGPTIPVWRVSNRKQEPDFSLAFPSTMHWRDSFLAFSPTDHLLVSCERGRELLAVWQVTEGAKPKFVHVKEPIYCMTFTPEGTELVCGTKGAVLFLCPHSGALLRRREGPSGSLGVVTVSPWRKSTLGGVWLENHETKTHSRLCIVGARTNKEWLRADLYQKDEEKVYSLAFSPNGQLLASAGFGGPVSLWEVGSGKKIFDLDFPHRKDWQWGKCVAFSPGGRQLAAATNSGLFLWNIDDCFLGSEKVPEALEGVALHTQ